MSGFQTSGIKRNFKELFDDPKRNTKSRYREYMDSYHESVYNAQIKLIVELERNLQKKVMEHNEYTGYYPDQLEQLIKDDKFKEDIKKDIDWLFTLHYKLFDRKLRTGLNHEEDIIEHMVEDKDPLEGLYTPSTNYEIVLYLYGLFMSPEIVDKYGKHQPVGDYDNNLRLDEEILGTSVNEEDSFNKEIEKINEKSQVTTGGKKKSRKSRKLKKSKKKTIKRKSTKRKSTKRKSKKH